MIEYAMSTYGGRNPNHQLKTVVNIPPFIGFQPSVWWFIGFRWPIQSMSTYIIKIMGPENGYKVGPPR